MADAGAPQEFDADFVAGAGDYYKQWKYMNGDYGELDP